MADHKPRVMLCLCHRISPTATSNPATPPDASHVPAPPCNPARAHPSHQIPEHVPELSGKREVTNVILQASSAGTFREFSSPVPTHRAPNVPGDLAHAARLQLLFINCFGCFRARVWHHSLPRQSHHLHSPLNQHCPVTRLSRHVCEAMAQKAQILPKASTAQCERQNHHFTWWYLAIIKSHIQGLCFHPACHRQLSSSARCCL